MRDSISYYVDLGESEVDIEEYETILGQFPEWRSLKREIKINSLIEKNKLQFDIGEIKSFSSSVFGTFEEEDLVPLSKACFVIKSMSFVLNCKKVEKLRIDIEILTTNYGKILQSLIDDEIPIQITQKINNNQVLGFFIKNQSKLVA